MERGIEVWEKIKITVICHGDKGYEINIPKTEGLSSRILRYMKMKLPANISCK